MFSRPEHGARPTTASRARMIGRPRGSRAGEDACGGGDGYLVFRLHLAVLLPAMGPAARPADSDRLAADAGAARRIVDPCRPEGSGGDPREAPLHVPLCPVAGGPAG